MIDSTQLKVLGKMPVFEGADAGRLKDLLPYLGKESFRRGEFVIQTGSQGDKVYFLVSGRVRVRKILAMNLDYLGYKPMEIVEDLGTFDPGYHFGEMALVGNRERSADVIAEEDCELVIISKESFDRIVREMPEIGQKMLLAFCNTLATWIRTYDKKLIENVQNRTLIQLLTAEKKKSVAMHRITRSTVFSTAGQVFDTILEACMDCLGVEKGSLMIFKEGDLRVEAAFGLDKFEISDKVQEIRESSVSGRCFMSGQALLVEDLRKVEGLKGAGDGSKYFNPSLLSVPLTSLKGETLGVINLNNKTSRGIFNEEDKVMLQELAQEAGAVLGYEIERLKKSPKTAVLSSNQSFATEKRSLPEDFVSLAGFVGKTSDYRIIYEDMVRSTNDMAGELIKKGYGHGTVIVANGQSHGKGRSGKVWLSPSGLNIYMTIVVMPKQEDLVEKIPLVNLVTSLSVANALRDQTGLEVRLKWPNTLTYSNKDLGGILSESLISGNQLYGLSTGIGVNVNQDMFPADLKAGSTSLYLETGKRHDRGRLVVEILKKFDHYYSLLLTNSRAVIDEWMRISSTIHSNVRVITERGVLEGRAVSLNDQGMLVLELPDHQVLSLPSGEIVPVERE